MLYKELFTIYDQTNLSPELIALRLGVSNMTYRRWQKADHDKEVPELYQRGIIDSVYQLIGEGKVDAESTQIKNFLAKYTSVSNSFNAALTNLGFDKSELMSGTTDEDKLTSGLSKIGSQKKNQEYVDSFWKKIIYYKSFGEQWKENLSKLSSIIKSKAIPYADKFIAIGALVYLFSVFDLIPDYIPVFGYLDDFAILALACTYYGNKYYKKA